MVLKFPKIVSRLQFFADAGKKSKAAIAIYVYASKSSRFALLKNDPGYYADLQFRGYWHLKLINQVKFLLSQHFSDILTLVIL